MLKLAIVSRCAVVTLGLLLASTVLPASHAAMVPIAPPPSTLPGALQSQTDAYLFLESSGVLVAPLSVDISSDGLYNNASPGSAGVIGPGTFFSSYLIHHESVNFAFSAVFATYTFPDPVIGIITSDALLDASDAALANGGTLYPNGLAFRGLELPYLITPDSVFWAGNQVFISVVTNTQAVLDQMRVITSPIPEPSTLWLATIALGSMLWVGVRRRVKR